MEILLTQDVANLGRVGDVVTVKNGYARNYLIPQQLAIPATKGALKQAEILRQAADKRRARELASAQDVGKAVSQLSLRFERKVGDKGRLYGSVTSADIAEAIDAKLGGEIDKRRIHLDEAIKTLGNFEVPVHLHSEVIAHVKVEVVGDNGETAADFAEASDATVIPSDPQPDADY